MIQGVTGMSQVQVSLTNLSQNTFIQHKLSCIDFLLVKSSLGEQECPADKDYEESRTDESREYGQ